MAASRWLLAFAVLAIGAGSLWAGDGTISGGKLNLTVYFEFEPTDAQFTEWETLFTNANPILMRATNGQLAFGTITMTTCPSAKDRADVRVATGSGRASAQGGIPGLGQNGRYIATFANDVSDPETLVHELGHYALGCYDEYKGKKRTGGVGGAIVMNGASQWFDGTGDPATNPWFCQTKATVNTAGACIMDFSSGWKKDRKNFCLDGVGGDSHVVGKLEGGVYYRTDQHEMSGHACWVEVAAAVGGAVPTAIPNFTGPAPAITFERVSGDAFVVCIDRSGSMLPFDSEDKIGQAKLGAIIAVLKARSPLTGPPAKAGERLGITSFSTTAGTDFNVAEMTGANKTGAITAIALIVADGSTAIGDGLRVSLNNLLADQTAAGKKYCSRSIILLSDGQNNSGESPTGSVLADCVAAKVNVYTLAIGSDADAATLAAIAAGTGGTSHYAGAGGLASAMSRIFSAARGGATAAAAAGTAAPGSSTPVTMNVDSFTTEATFTLASGNAADPLALGLTDPNGNVINLGAPPANVQVSTSNGITVVIIDNPVAGSWTATVDATGTAASQTYDVELSALSEVLSVTAETDQDTYQYPDAILVRVVVHAGQAVQGCTVTATVTRPDNTTSALTLFDDGNEAVHGDRRPGDGTYSNFFSAYTGDGSYTFDVQVQNTTGTTAGIGFTDQPGGPAVGGVAVPAFASSVLFSRVCSGVPPGGAAGLLPPGLLEARTTTPGEVTLSWTDTNGGAAGTAVERRSGSTGAFSVVGTVAAGTTTFPESGLDTSGTFQYRVAASNASGTSSPSNLASIEFTELAAVTPDADGGGGGGCAAPLGTAAPLALALGALLGAAAGLRGLRLSRTGRG